MIGLEIQCTGILLIFNGNYAYQGEFTLEGSKLPTACMEFQRFESPSPYRKYLGACGTIRVT